MESDPASDIEFRRPLRLAVPENHCDGHEQRCAARGFCMDAIRIAEDGDPRKLRTVLRSRPVAGARECDSFGWKYDGGREPQPDQRQSFTRADGRPGISEYP